MLRPVLVTPPAETPVSLAQVKAHLRIEPDDTSEDALLGALIAAAVSYLDGWTGILGKCLVTQSWAQTFRSFPCDPFRLALGPVQTITSVKYFDASNVQQTYPSGNYDKFTDALGTFLRLGAGFSWPGLYGRSDAVVVTYACGYGDADAVPGAIKQAMLLLIGHWYQRRENVVDGQVSELPFAVSALLTPYLPQRL